MHVAHPAFPGGSTRAPTRRTALGLAAFALVAVACGSSDGKSLFGGEPPEDAGHDATSASGGSAGASGGVTNGSGANPGTTGGASAGATGNLGTGGTAAAGAAGGSAGSSGGAAGASGGSDAGAGGSTCFPATCATLAPACGSVSDGCGGTLDCGPCDTCVASARTEPSPCTCNFLDYVPCCQGDGSCGCRPAVGACAALGTTGGVCACVP